jgi:hypothetical protein
MKPDVVILTATLGRDSLKEVAKCVAAQTVPVEWVICCDGDEAREKVQDMCLGVHARIAYTPGPPQGPCGELVMRRHASLIEAPFVCFVDDDNLLREDHVELIRDALKKGRSFVSTRRIYMDEAGKDVCLEHPASELIDTNCSGMTAALFKQTAAFFEKAPFTVYDRHIQCYAMACGITPYVMQQYTVRYKMCKNMSAEDNKGWVVYECLSGTVFKIGKWTEYKE